MLQAHAVIDHAYTEGREMLFDNNSKEKIRPSVIERVVAPVILLGPITQYVRFAKVDVCCPGNYSKFVFCRRLRGPLKW